MISLYEFNQLKTLDQKADVVWDADHFIASREVGEHRVNLYRVSDFYVEIFYYTKTNRIENIRSFKADEHLDAYLDGIANSVKLNL